jgi:hypothetical protein
MEKVVLSIKFNHAFGDDNMQGCKTEVRVVLYWHHHLRLSPLRRRRFWGCPAATVPGGAAARKECRPREKFSHAEILTFSTTWPGKDEIKCYLVYNYEL